MSARQRLTGALRSLVLAGSAIAGSAWAGAEGLEDGPAASACPALLRLPEAQGRWAGKFGSIARACEHAARTADVEPPLQAVASASPAAPTDPDPEPVTVWVDGTEAAAAPLVLPAPARSKASVSARVERALALAPLIDQAARAHGIDPLLMHAMARVESAHRTEVVSPAGAVGLMQVLPATAARFGHAGHALHRPEVNLDASARYLKWLQARFRNDLKLVIAAYNAGEAAVERHGLRVPPYAETQAYVQRVLTEYEHLRATAERLRRGEGERLQGLM